MSAKPSSLVDTSVIYCGDNLDQLEKLPAHCVDLIYIAPPFNSNRNYEVFWGETHEKRSSEDRRGGGGDKRRTVGGRERESTRASIDYMRPRGEHLSVLQPPGNLQDVIEVHYVLPLASQKIGEAKIVCQN